MLTLAFPYLLLLLPLPWLFHWLMPHAQTKQRHALKVPFLARLQNLHNRSTITQQQQRNWRYYALGLLWTLLVIAASCPRWLGDVINLPRQGRDIMLVMDISGSMEITDMTLKGKLVDRLTAVKDVASEFIGQRQGDRIGLILFGSKAYLQAPLTYDRKTVTQLLNDATIGLAGQQTAIGDGLGLGLKHLLKANNKSRVMILLTDGVNNAGSIQPLEAAKLTQQQNIPVYTIGLGAEQLYVNNFFGQQAVNPSANIDAVMLSAIAKQSGGFYFRAKDTQGLRNIYQRIDKLHPTITDQATWQPMKNLYLWPLLLALLLSLALLWRYLPWPQRWQQEATQ